MDLRLPDRTDAGWERHRILVAVTVFAVMALLAAVDLVGDLREGTTFRHAVVEGAIVLAGTVGIGMLTFRLAELRRREREALAAASGLARDLAESRAAAERWRAEARDLLLGLGTLIDRQLTRWGLTAAEKEVALLLLKGLSHKEVARARDVSEATARQQAAAVYRKAGLGGRHDLAAFFLEDLLSPRIRE
jgi:DNA-binding CsgD family transcriptional regulator